MLTQKINLLVYYVHFILFTNIEKAQYNEIK